MSSALKVEIGETVRDHQRQQTARGAAASANGNPRGGANNANNLSAGPSSVQRYSGQMSQMDPTLDEFSYYSGGAGQGPRHMLDPAEVDGGGPLSPQPVEYIEPSMPVVKKSRKKHLKKLQNPRNFSKIDSLMRFLEDKRVEDASQLEDLQMPRLRLVLNIVFVALGVCFLMGVIGVIIYSAVASGKDQ